MNHVNGIAILSTNINAEVSRRARDRIFSVRTRKYVLEHQDNLSIDLRAWGIELSFRNMIELRYGVFHLSHQANPRHLVVESHMANLKPVPCHLNGICVCNLHLPCIF